MKDLPSLRRHVKRCHSGASKKTTNSSVLSQKRKRSCRKTQETLTNSVAERAAPLAPLPEEAVGEDSIVDVHSNKVIESMENNDVL
jgi:hypothetical protein